VTALEAYDLTAKGGGAEFAFVIAACESCGPYTLGADIVATSPPPQLPGAKSDLRIEFTTDERHQPFVSRATEREVFGVRARVESLEDVVQGKLWAWSDPARRLRKHKKDELDLIRLAEKYPELALSYRAELRHELNG
jgi:hypothetical protein